MRTCVHVHSTHTHTQMVAFDACVDIGWHRRPTMSHMVKPKWSIVFVENFRCKSREWVLEGEREDGSRISNTIMTAFLLLLLLLLLLRSTEEMWNENTIGWRKIYEHFDQHFPNEAIRVAIGYYAQIGFGLCVCLSTRLESPNEHNDPNFVSFTYQTAYYVAAYIRLCINTKQHCISSIRCNVLCFCSWDAWKIFVCAENGTEST